MAGLRLLPGEKEELHLHPAQASLIGRRALSSSFALWAVVLALAFHAPWWTGHRASDWTAAWTWLWGSDAAAYLWTVAGLAVGGAVASIPTRRWTRLWVCLVGGIAVALLASVSRLAPTTSLPVLTLTLVVPAQAWLEACRLGTHYHVTNLRLVVRTTLPRRAETSALYADLVDIDARRAAWPDMGTLVPVARRASAETPSESHADGPAEGALPVRPAAALRMPGIRPFRRVRELVALLAQRATASDYLRSEHGLDAQVAEALAAMHRP